MGDPVNPNTTQILPPGCRFFPSDEQLVCYYLTHKNNRDSPFGFDVIKEIDLYKYDPFDLPETACFRFGRGGRKRHWYCYAEARVLKGGSRRRAVGCSGYWKRKTAVRDVVVGSGAAKVVVGTRKTFVYHLGEFPKTAVRTDWLMYEYSLIDPKLDAFVLCRVFVKSVRRNSLSEHPLSSCAEESVATVCHVGVQYDGTISSGYGEIKAGKGGALDHENEILRFPSGLVSETRGPDHISGNSVVGHTLSADEIMAILEEDYIELDDFVCPLPSVD